MSEIHEISLLSIDVGFNLKDTQEPILLGDYPLYKIKYEDKKNRQLEICGDLDKVGKILRKAGYKVEIRA